MTSNRPVVDPLDQLADELADAVHRAWRSNWTSSEILRVVDRSFAAHVSAAACAGLVVARRRHPAERSAVWVGDHEQAVAAAGDLRSISFGSPHELHDLIGFVGRLPRMVDVTVRRVGEPGDADARVLSKVRALLAKAEATTFEGEADAFTAKAHELMSRHSIATAMLEDPDESAPAAVRIWHERPYVKAQASLLGAIADAASCRAVYQPGFEVSTVFGMGTDLDAVELLFTSLLVQSAAELRAAEAGGGVPSSRRKSFRNAFHHGYADRVGWRLHEVREAARREAVDTTPGLHPVLVSRDLAVDDAVADAFPKVGTMRRSVSNGVGYRAGDVAGRRADLGPGGRRLNRR